MKPEREFAETSSIPFTPTVPPLAGLDERIIVESGQPGVVTRMLRFAPNVDTTPNGTLAHSFWEEVYILRGSMTDLRLGAEFTTGDFASRPPGMEHGPWRAGPEGCLTFEVRYTA